jgi:hypothetical protein
LSVRCAIGIATVVPVPLLVSSSGAEGERRDASADLAAVGALRVDLGEAADIIWATNAPEVYQLLVGQRGWSPDRYERFLADTWRRLLLAG